MEIYFASVGRNATLTLGLAPDRTGRLAGEDVARLRELGEYLRFLYRVDHGAGKNAVADSWRGRNPRFAPGNAVDRDYHTYWAAEDGVTHACLEIDLAGPCTFDVIRVQEYIPLGQRVEAWAVDAWVEASWRQIGAATTIGHKRLLRLPRTTSSRVRLRITRTKACPVINEVGLHLTPQSP